MINTKYFYLDMHTLGLKDDSAILSIHLSYIDKNDIFNERKSFFTYSGENENHLNIYLDRTSQIDKGATTDQGVIGYWMDHVNKETEPDIVNKILYGDTSMEDAVKQIREFTKPKAVDDVIFIESSGGFAFSKLESLFKRVGEPFPYKHTSVRCLRTLVATNRGRLDDSHTYNDIYFSNSFKNEATSHARAHYLDKEKTTPIQAYTTLFFLHLTGSLL